WNLEKLLSTPADGAEQGGAEPAEQWSDDEETAAHGGAPESGAEPANELDHDHDHDGGSVSDEVDAEDEESERAQPVRRPGRRARPARHHARARVPIDKLLKKGQMVAVQI